MTELQWNNFLLIILIVVVVLIILLVMSEVLTIPQKNTNFLSPVL